MIGHPSQLIPFHRSDGAYDVVAVATSAGGLRALSTILAALPAPFPLAILIVQHIAPRRPSLLPDILRRQTTLRVKQAEAGDVLRPHTVYIAPPDRHLLVDTCGVIHLSDSERVNFARPAADRLFESVAASFKERAIAVVLTGNGSDGAKGIQAIKQRGGTTIAQNEATSEYFGMPRAAIQTGAVDYVLPIEAIAPKLIELTALASVTHPKRPHMA